MSRGACFQAVACSHRASLLRWAVTRVRVSCLDRRFGAAWILGLVWNPAKSVRLRLLTGETRGAGLDI